MRFLCIIGLYTFNACNLSCLAVIWGCKLKQEAEIRADLLFVHGEQADTILASLLALMAPLQSVSCCFDVKQNPFRHALSPSIAVAPKKKRKKTPSKVLIFCIQYQFEGKWWVRQRSQLTGCSGWLDRAAWAEMKNILSGLKNVSNHPITAKAKDSEVHRLASHMLCWAIDGAAVRGRMAQRWERSDWLAGHGVCVGRFFW